MIRRSGCRIRRGVAVVGSTTIDRNICNGVGRLQLGGVTTYAGLAYRRHGLPTWIVTRIAPAHRPLLSRLSAAGIRIHAAGSDRTTQFINYITGSRRTQQMPSRAAPIRCNQVRRVLDRVDCIHLGPLHPADIECAVFHLLRDQPTLVVADLQGLVRRLRSGRVIAGAGDALAPALAAADVVKTDADELETVLAALGGDVAGLMAAFAIQEWVVTARERGGQIFTACGGRHPYSAEPAVAGGDPTGAGDVFLAAYTAARFAEGLDVDRAGAQAAAAAACHVADGLVRRTTLDLAPNRLQPEGGRPIDMPCDPL